MRTKVLLITPPYHCGVVEAAGTWLPLPFVFLAGSLRQAGYEVEIYDAMSMFHTHSDIRERLSETDAQYIATTAYTASINDALEVLRSAKNLKPQVTTIIGGVHATFCWREILTEHSQVVDFVVRGEGERTIVELLDCLQARDNPEKVAGIAFSRDGQPLATRTRVFVKSLDELPLAWDLIDWSLYSYRPTPGSTLAVVSSSRGCNQECSFCSQQLFWRRSWRAMSPEKLVTELKFLHEKYGVNVAMICDETPTLDQERWERILDLLIGEKMDLELLMETRVSDIVRDEAVMEKYRKAGFVHIYVGVESAEQETLDKFKKNIKVEESRKAIELINKAGIISETSFVLGMPDETPETIRQTLELAKHYNPDLAFFLAIAPWPYSDIYKEIEPYIETKDYSQYNLVEPVARTRAMTRDDLRKSILQAFRDFYMWKLKQLDQMEPFKRDYMLSVTELLATNSYLADQMKGMGKIPGQVAKILKRLPLREKIAL